MSDYMSRPDPGCQQLARAVLLTAVRDVERGRPSDRADARQFLAGGPMLSFWAELAGFRADRLRRDVLASLAGTARLPDNADARLPKWRWLG